MPRQELVTMQVYSLLLEMQFLQASQQMRQELLTQKPMFLHWIIIIL